MRSAIPILLLHVSVSVVSSGCMWPGYVCVEPNTQWQSDVVSASCVWRFVTVMKLIAMTHDTSHFTGHGTLEAWSISISISTHETGNRQPTFIFHGQYGEATRKHQQCTIMCFHLRLWTAWMSHVVFSFNTHGHGLGLLSLLLLLVLVLVLVRIRVLIPETGSKSRP